MADANDEERDNCRNQNEYECGSQERPRQPTHSAVPPGASHAIPPGASARTRLWALGAALPREFPLSAARGPDLGILVVADHPLGASQSLPAATHLPQPVIE